MHGSRSARRSAPSRSRGGTRATASPKARARRPRSRAAAAPGMRAGSACRAPARSRDRRRDWPCAALRSRSFPGPAGERAAVELVVALAAVDGVAAPAVELSSPRPPAKVSANVGPSLSSRSSISSRPAPPSAMSVPPYGQSRSRPSPPASQSSPGPAFSRSPPAPPLCGPRPRLRRARRPSASPTSSSSRRRPPAGRGGARPQHVRPVPAASRLEAGDPVLLPRRPGRGRREVDGDRLGTARVAERVASVPALEQVGAGPPSIASASGLPVKCRPRAAVQRPGRRQGEPVGAIRPEQRPTVGADDVIAGAGVDRGPKEGLTRHAGHLGGVIAVAELRVDVARENAGRGQWTEPSG